MRGGFLPISVCSSSTHHHHHQLGLLFLCPPSRSLQLLQRSTPFVNPNLLIHPSTKFLLLLTSKKSTSIHSSDFNQQQQQEQELDKDDDIDDDDPGTSDELDSLDGVQVEIVKLGRNSRRIVSRITIDAVSLDTIWSILTDYERLSDFIPSLSVSQVLQKGQNYARLFQIGQQDLAFGLNFNAKGIVDCYEKDLETLPSGGRRRDIDFNMIEGDFQLFQGKWSIEETYSKRPQDIETCVGGEEYQATTTTTLSYVVDVKPKLWLPVGLVQGRLCREVKMNLLYIREEAQKRVDNSLNAL